MERSDRTKAGRSDRAKVQRSDRTKVEPSDGTKVQRSDWAGVAFGLGLAAFGAFQQFKLPPVLPLLLESYHYDRSLAGGLMSVYAAAGLALSIVFGRWITRRGVGRPLVFALAVMAAGNLAGLAAPAEGWVMLGARGLEGLAFTVLAIAGPVLANRHASERHRPLVIGLTAAWIPTGQIVAGGLAPLLVPSFGWQALWLVGLGATLVMALCLAGRYGAERRATPAPAMHAGGRDDQLAGQHLLLIVAGAIFLFWSGQYFAAMTWMPQYFVEAQGLPLAVAQLGSLLPVVVLAGFNLITGYLLGHGLSLAGLLVFALASQAALWLLMPSLGDAGLGLGVIALVAYGIGAGISPTCLFAVPNRLMGAGPGQARAFGIIMTGRNVGVLLGPVVLAEAFKLSGSWSAAAPIFGGATSVALLLAVFLLVRLRDR